MKKLISISLLSILLFAITISCGKKNSDGSSFVDAQLSDFQSILNSKESKKTLIKVVDPDYYRGEIEITLFDDETFTYKFNNDEVKEGRWIFENNSIKLDASYYWIPLQMHVFFTNNSKKIHGLQFVDSQGIKRRILSVK